MTESMGGNRNRLILIALLVLCTAPFVIALALYSGRSRMVEALHHGNLIAPAIPVSLGNFVGFDPFSTENIGEIRGHWVLVQFIAPRGCGTACRESLKKTRQVRLMLSKDLMRVRRVAVVGVEISLKQADEWWLEHPDLLRSCRTDELEKIATAATGSGIADGTVFIMDPIGNFMMWYPADFDPYGLKKDMQRLLRVSQIG